MTNAVQKHRTPLLAANEDCHDSGSGGDGGNMKVRVEKLEDKVAGIATDIAVIKSNYSTREHVSNAKVAIITWVSSVVVLSSLLPSLLKHLGIL